MHYFKSLLLTMLCATLLSACSFNPTVDITHAATYKNTAYLQEYIDKGVDVNFQDQAGDTALMNAVLFGHNKNVKLLLSKGADVALRSKTDATAMTSVDQLKPVDREIVELLIANGADINDREAGDRTALMVALLYHSDDDNRIDDIKFFIEKGSDVNLLEKDGTPLFWSICGLGEEIDYKSLIDLFLLKGLEINAKDSEGDTLLVLSSCQENENMYEYLVEKGAK